jgi:glutathione S-transferase
MSLVFYYSPLSSAVTVHWALEELGIPYEKVKIDLRAGGQKKPEYLAINPNGKVPAIVHDGTKIFESVAILIHLGETFGVEKGLFPAPGLARADAIKWLVWCNVSLGEALSRFLHASSDRMPKEEHNAAAAAAAKADVEHLLDILDAGVKGRKYLAGDALSLADLHVAGWADYLKMVGFDTARWSNITAWSKPILARPTYATIMSP